MNGSGYADCCDRFSSTVKERRAETAPAYLVLLVSAVVLALAVAWWMVRARGEPSVVAALACWWFVASIFGPAALIVILPWLRGFRHRSLGWITTAVSGEAASRV